MYALFFLHSISFSSCSLYFLHTNISGGTRVCDLCGSPNALLSCGACHQQLFCAACDEMYHKHPKRIDHERVVSLFLKMILSYYQSILDTNYCFGLYCLWWDVPQTSKEDWPWTCGKFAFADDLVLFPIDFVAYNCLVISNFSALLADDLVFFSLNLVTC